MAYASVALPFEEGRSRLRAAMDSLLDGLDLEAKPQVLWSMQYHQLDQAAQESDSDAHTICLPSLSSDLALDDNEVEVVKKTWLRITGESEDGFLKFNAREGMEDDD